MNTTRGPMRSRTCRQPITREHSDPRTSSGSPQLEFAAAHRVFQRLGATADLAAIERLRPSGSGSATPLTPRESQVLRLLAKGETNRAIAGVREQRVQLAGVSTSILEGGGSGGPAVILLHGPGDFAAKWVRVLPVLRHTTAWSRLTYPIMDPPR
jgi:Bacterial regulatory proteins, luxR family